MIREVVKIDENLCDGCGLCIPGCHEGALQVIDGKARLISDLMCDGLGACLGHCPQQAITIERREAVPYDEVKVMEIMAEKGKNTVIAHLKHLKEHNETEYMKAGMGYLRENKEKLGFDLREVIDEVHGANHHDNKGTHLRIQTGAGCPGSKSMAFDRSYTIQETNNVINRQSELSHWPVQMHLINPDAPYYRNADVVIAADCTAFAMGDFHNRYLKGRSLAIACPKLDSNIQVYVQKVKEMIDRAQVNTITVMIMQVPCCRGLLQIVQNALSEAQRKVPLKLVVVNTDGNIIMEEWQ